MTISNVKSCSILSWVFFVIANNSVRCILQMIWKMVNFLRDMIQLWWFYAFHSCPWAWLVLLVTLALVVDGRKGRWEGYQGGLAHKFPWHLSETPRAQLELHVHDLEISLRQDVSDLHVYVGYLCWDYLTNDQGHGRTICYLWCSLYNHDNWWRDRKFFPQKKAWVVSWVNLELTWFYTDFFRLTNTFV